MAAIVLGGPLVWEGEMDDEGHRSYQVVIRVLTSSSLEGPAVVMNAIGIPAVGSTYLVDSDVDLWAWRMPGMRVKAVRDREANKLWEVTLRYTTKPPQQSQQRCNTTPIEDPLLEPQKVSGSFIKKTEEATHDRFGQPILTSSHEQINGPQNEWDADGGDTISIEQNVADLELELLVALKNTVNDAPLWGLPARCIKFNSYSWEKKFYGACSHYYTRRLEFEANSKTFDRDLVDEGTKALHGHWSPDANEWILDPVYASGGVDVYPDRAEPSHFSRYKDRNGENARVILDGFGEPFIPEQPVTGCSECSGGSPETWKAYGIAGREEPLELTYDSDCTWSYTGDGTVELTHSDVENVWKITDTAMSLSEWRIAEGSWSCMGPNTLVRTIGTQGNTTITLVKGSSVGNIHVEKYTSANLLALGIPTTL